MIKLGISAFYHDSAAAIVIDGEVIAAIEEEKFTNIKHDNSFPLQAIEWCLKSAKISIDKVDMICWYEEPKLKYDRVEATLGKSWLKNFKKWTIFKKEFSNGEGNLKDYFKTQIGYTGPITYVKHHLSHLALSFYTSPFEEAIGMSIDGVGEWDTVVVADCDKTGIKEKHSIKFPNSLGLVYSSITAYLGFKPNGGEYKVMGLAPYGNSTKYSHIFNKISKVNEDGTIDIKQKYFTWKTSNTDMYNFDLVELIGFEPRLSESNIEQEHMDLAASLQQWYESQLYFLIRNELKGTDKRNLVLGGGCAYNGTANGKIKANTEIQNVWIPYAPSDAGSAIGACLYYWHDILAHQKVEGGNNISPYLGPSYTDYDIQLAIRENLDDIVVRKLSDSEILKETAQMINNGSIVGWFQGRTEFGARALGNRSILANPHISDIRDKINRVVKKREMFRPFAPSVTVEDYQTYFISESEVPYMNQVVKVSDFKKIPSVTHVDKSARIHTVRREQNEKYYDLLKEFEKISGTPILLNTSFNLRGHTVTNDPKKAIWTFLNSEMDYLIIENYLISK